MSTVDEAVLRQVSDQLGHYVYALIDPRDGVPFYVGKGQRGRVLDHGLAAAHLSDDGDEAHGARSPKLRRIQDIRSSGAEPTIWLLRYGLSADEYTAVEATAIDLLMSLPIAAGNGRVPLTEASQLTNGRREATRGSGIMTLDQLVADLAAPVLETTTPLLLITLRDWKPLNDEPLPGGGTHQGAGFKRAWLNSTRRRAEIDALADATRCWWRIDLNRVARTGTKHAVAVYGGVTRELFRIAPGTWETRDDGRRGFQAEPILAGPLFDAVVGAHGHRVPPRLRGDRSELKYWPRHHPTTTVGDGSPRSRREAVGVSPDYVRPTDNPMSPESGALR